ncbi:MAG: TonB-dependent receptor [Cyclobacteriaceae bacterium]|nr:TonB-dependent receptor [Cyclobacteriaceae bacterium]
MSVLANGLLGGAPWGNLSDPLSGYHNTDSRFGGGINATYNLKKTSLYAGLYYNKKNVNGDRMGDASVLQPDGSYFHMVARGERPEWYENYSANVGGDFTLSAHSTLSASYYVGNRTEGRSAFYVYDNFFGDIYKAPINDVPVDDELIYNPNTDSKYGKFQSANVDLNIAFDNNSSLGTSLLYEHSSLRRKLDNRNYDYNTLNIGELEEHFMQQDALPLDGYRLSLDYEKVFDNGESLAVGIQPYILTQQGAFSYDTLNAAQNSWGSYTALENDIELYRGVYAFYTSYKGSVKKLSYQVGLRLEQTDQKLEMSNPNYFNIFDRPAESTYLVNQLDWFPSLHLSYDFSDTDQLIAAASRRINRPPTKNMAPFLYRRHFEVYEVGDPALEPEYISNAEITYNKDIGNQNFALTGFFRNTNNAVFRVNTVYQEENVLIRSYTNAGNTESLGAELNANLALGAKIKLFAGGSLYHFMVTGDIFGYRENNQSTNYTLKGNLNWQLLKSVKLSADLNYKSATVTPQGENERFYLANAAITYTPAMLEGWSFALRGIDLLVSNLEGLHTRAYNNEGVQIFYQEVLYDRYGPILEFGVTYGFNSKSNVKKNAKSTFGDEQF